MNLKSVNWIITDRCNGRCVHCDMWNKAGRRGDLCLDDIGRILSDKVIRQGYKRYGRDYDISFAGGEPFLRDDLQAIVNLVEKMYPGSFKCITSNGLLEERILRFVEQNSHLHFKLNISLDGLEETNDALRGARSFRKTVHTIRAVKRRFPDQAIEIKLTLSPHNYDQIVKVYTLASKLGCQFSFKPFENLKNYTNSRKTLDLSFTPQQLCVIRNQCFRLADLMYRQGNFKKARFYQDIPFYLAKKKMPTSCSVLNECLTIMPAGECYFCLKEPSVNSVPQRPLIKTKKVPGVGRFKCRSCMLLCGVYKDYTNAPFEKTIANIETINRCNLRCSICTQKGLRSHKPEEMDLNRFRKLIRRLPDTSHVSFIGGEPFLNKSFFAMMNHLDKKAITYEITTNGTLINAGIVERLKSCIGLKGVLFSLDGLETYHDKERGRGTFNKCMRALNLMKDFFSVGVGSVLKADNQEDIIKLSGLLSDLGIRDHRIIYGMSLSGEARKQSSIAAPRLIFQGPQFEEQAGDDQGIMKFFQSLERADLRNGMKITYVPELFRSQTKLFLAEDLAQKRRVTCAQLGQFRFNAKGERIICEFIRNRYDLRTANSLRQQLLPICEKCCKLKSI
ncbi:MAG: radical SAM protein [Candidatus Omnitrophica bacterium]|nr:radical SAM protein [Candidatus Omnitrophota bacterium]